MEPSTTRNKLEIKKIDNYTRAIKSESREREGLRRNSNFHRGEASTAEMLVGERCSGVLIVASPPSSLHPNLQERRERIRI